MSFFSNWIATHAFNPYALYRWTDDMSVDARHSVVARHKSVSELLTSKAFQLEHESGFFRLGQSHLPAEAVRQGSAALRGLLHQTSVDRAGRAQQILSTYSGRTFSTRSIGQRMILTYFAQAILRDRPKCIQDAVSNYVRFSVIPDDVRRRSFRHYATLPELRQNIATAIQEADVREPVSDMLDIALTVAPSRIGAAELLQRLTLSTVGFTGAALEWILIQASKKAKVEGRSRAENRVRETLRLASPACRLTRTTSQGASLGDLSFPPEHELIINVRSANRDQSVWRDAETFIPSRWEAGEAKKNDLTFGKGARSCPAQRDAIEALVDFQKQLDTRYRVSFIRAPFSTPLVGTLLAPPLGLMTLHEEPHR
ncbi:cytochrome P450 [Brachybacterium sp. YJGR34]|uniref:cytochrome P450 n=1 Tax=Brachybacterium sp. YJGR34 TaxID=2059911 RepID=UPI000E0C3C90